MTERRTVSYNDHYFTNQNNELQKEYDRRKLRESRRQAQARKRGSLLERPGERGSKTSKVKQRGRVKVKKSKKVK